MSNLDRAEWFMPYVRSDLAWALGPVARKYPPQPKLTGISICATLKLALMYFRWYLDRPTRSEQSLEGAAVNGLTPVGQEASPRDG